MKLVQDAREEPGSPDLKEKILQNISSCQFFVCDVTLVNPDSSGRKMPNPNVMFELGYAVKRLGWERIILVYNTCNGRIEDLPFDIRSHRPQCYKIIGDRNNHIESILTGTRINKASQIITLIVSYLKQTASKLPRDACKCRTEALPRGTCSCNQSNSKLISEKNKKTNSEMKKDAIRKISKSIISTVKLIVERPDFKCIPPDYVDDPDKKIKKDRDVNSMKKLLAEVDADTFQHFYNESLRGLIVDDIFHYWEGFKAVYESPAFYLYDENLKKAVDALYEHWQASLSYGDCFNTAQGGYCPFTSAIQVSACFNQIQQAFLCFSKLCQIINNDYSEINIAETSRLAAANYKKFANKCNQALASDSDSLDLLNFMQK
ncbi:TIR domain-containing protein [Megalodesulfovibrio gigas]|uniref:TIR domain-containing protein n=1 Tax=Megalodesulfovibrio gigas TaxID=879 RepID=UPI000425D5A7|nr:TIR domain-containing protein [Megalodesulfovibrio gigas]